jgi:hypothetical protein
LPNSASLSYSSPNRRVRGENGPPAEVEPNEDFELERLPADRPKQAQEFDIPIVINEGWNTSFIIFKPRQKDLRQLARTI